MNTLFRYILREFLKALLFTTLAFAALVIVAELVDDMRSFVSHKPAVSLVVLYYIYRTPFYLVQILPLSILLSALFSLGQLGRQNELIAMRACGISFYRIAFPILSAALALVALVLVFNEIVIPYTNPRAYHIKRVNIEHKRDTFLFRRDWLTRSVSGNRIVHARHLDAVANEMKEIILIQRAPDRSVTERIDAKRAEWQYGTWYFFDGVRRTFDAAGRVKTFEPFTEFTTAFRNKPSDFIRQNREEDQLLAMTLKDLSRQIKLLRETGSNPRTEEVNYHLKIAFPFANFILALLGVSLPFIFPTGQRAVIWTAIGFVITIVTGFFYIGFIAVGTSFGKNGTLPPVLSVWIANALFFILGVILIRKTRS